MDQTPGTILRQKREEKKLTLDQVFQGTKIRINYLQAIENDQLGTIPSLAQARGFIRLYASFLDLDPYALLVPHQPEPVADEPVKTEAAHVEVTPAKENTINEKLTGLLHEGSEKVTGAWQDRSDRVKESVQHLLDKIPYKVVKKGDETGADLEKKVKAAPQFSIPVNPPQSGSTYRAMCRAIGDDLRKQREALGLSLADAERQTRIREFYLFAIEEGNLDDLPSTVQGRGMLSNYASFMNLDSEAFLSRFAEALQQRRREMVPDAKAGVPIPVPQNQKPITGWRRLVSPDMIFTGGLFLVFFVFIIWGAFQLMGTGASKTSATVIPISDLLLSSGTPLDAGMVTVVGVTTQTTQSAEIVFTPSTNLEATLAATGTGPIQLVIVAQRRAYMKITVDGKEVFTDRVVPGQVYSYSGSKKITLLSGDGAALHVYYNQDDLGILGISGQVISMEFTTSGMVDLAAQFTPTKTVTQAPTLTPNPTAAPTKTPIQPTATVTPFAPTTQP